MTENEEATLVGEIPAERVESREGVPVYVTSPSMLRETIRKLVDLGFDYLLSISGVDEPKEQRVRIIYHLTSSSSPRNVVAVEVSVPRQDPRVPSISDIIPAALFQEREEHEMLGIVFEGLSDTRHLLLPSDWPKNVYPLRKDFVVRDESIMSPQPSKPLSVLKGKEGENI